MMSVSRNANLSTCLGRGIAHTANLKMVDPCNAQSLYENLLPPSLRASRGTLEHHSSNQNGIKHELADMYF